MIFSLPESRIVPHFSLAAVSSMKTGGNAAFAFFPESAQELALAFEDAKKTGLRTVTAGGTSNLLFPDKAEDLCVIFTQKMTSPLLFDGETAHCACGVMLPKLSAEAARRGLSGLEFACGIPGTVGGALYMNAGAYGGEMAQAVRSVTVYSRKTGGFFELSREQCAFSYRHSIFSEKRELIVTDAVFSLQKGNPNEIAARCAELKKQRREKQPLEYPSCGSAFKRPEGHFAGKLIEDCGLKGFAVGGACISEKHAGFIINRSGATSDDVRKLIETVQTVVYEKTGVRLEPEIEIL